MEKSHLEAIKRMYNALMAIGAVNPGFHKKLSYARAIEWGFERRGEIANACLKEMNVEYTELIARALGIRE